MKVFLLLLGFYTANALATILGQTEDWDVLVAGVVVAAIERTGMLMYKKSSSVSTTIRSMSTKFGCASYNVMLITLSRTSNNGQFFFVVGLQVAPVVASFTLAFLDSLYVRIGEIVSITGTIDVENPSDVPLPTSASWL